MAKRLPLPTDVELQILRVLWEHGPCSLGQAHQVLSQSRDKGYTTTQKMIQVMMDKGLVARDESVRPNLYRAAASQDKTQLRLIDDLAKRAFGGSAKKLAMSLLLNKRLKLEELEELHRLIEEAEKD